MASWRPSGHGTKFGPDGSSYTGRFYKGQAFGKGKLWFRNILVYDGNFTQDKYHGRGTHFTLDGVFKYRGKSAYRMESGDGVLFATDGSHLNGSFKNGEPIAPFKVYTADGTLTYQGGWDGVPFGFDTSVETHQLQALGKW